MCPDCKGRGKKSQRIRKKARLSYQRAVEQFEKSNGKSAIPVKPKGHLSNCKDCDGTGLIESTSIPQADDVNYPHVAIIGGGIGGVALAVACLHRHVPFTLYERDESFDARSQGYGLTLQQASKAIQGLGIPKLEKGVVSTRHVVHNTAGAIIGEWGMRKWLENQKNTTPKRTNIHIARQSLRQALLDQLGDHPNIKWGHRLIDYQETDKSEVELKFQVKDEIIKHKANLIVGADGIRSTVRNLILGDEKTPLRYLDCIVILGICPLHQLEDLESDLLDSATVFQTANGHERIYMMPYDTDSIMWQLSFPMTEADAKELSSRGSQALKEEASRRTQWHDPIPKIITATTADLISGYPVYDRELLNPELLKNSKLVTLLGDAAHPMSPFKGQGANQALLDALSLARSISHGCRPQSDWRTNGIRASVLDEFEEEMTQRSSIKVKDSAAAAQFLHTDVVLYEGDEPRGRVLKRKQ
ncbi:MAG: FAD-dependent oxidoreductase [Nonlabens sp.]|uniref:FAD-dependent oxidoreductase n=1 Tax=Nonlabens sp. TaxID=1888209 RepID=UPI003EF9749C